MKKFIYLASAIWMALFLLIPQANAQSQRNPCYYTTANPGSGNGCIPVSSANPLPVAATVSVGGFTPGLTFATLTATGSSASVALPVGTTVYFQNNGTTTVSCTLGVGSATALANEILVPASSGVPVVVGSNTWGACIDQTGSTSNLIVLAGGSGLGNAFGGGSSGGGSSGAVFGPTAVGSANVNPPVVIGGTLTVAAGQNVAGAAVKAASTQAAATDTSLVVQENPNGPLLAAINAGAAPPSAGAATATTSSLIGCQYLTTQPTFTTTWQGACNFSSRGELLVAPGVSGFPVSVASGGLASGAFASGSFAAVAATKAASTPAAATDIALVVDQRPGTTVATQGQVNVTATACSATVVTGNTAVNAFTAQTTLHGFTIANIDTTEVMWISFTTTAAASGTDSYPIPAATATSFAGFGSFTAPPGFGLNHALSVVAATNGHKFSCTYW